MTHSMSAGMPVTDDGRRLSDAVTLAILAGGRGAWIAARLSDGGTDGQIYDTRTDAIRHQLHEDQCAYIRVPLAGDMPPIEATAYLDFNRRRLAAGFRMVDPEQGSVAPISYTPEFLNRAARRQNTIHARTGAVTQAFGKLRNR